MSDDEFPDRRKPTAAQTKADLRQSPIDVRLKIIFACMILMLAGLGAVAHMAAANCRAIDHANQKFNDNVDFQFLNTAASQLLSPAEKAKRLAQLAQFHLPIVFCPPV